jgi:hypothetical protein
MSFVRNVLQAVGRLVGEDLAPPPPAPRTDGERLARAVLDGDEEAALALADLVLMTYQRVQALPAGLTFEAVAWPHRAKSAFHRMGIKTFNQLLAIRPDDLLAQPGVGDVTLRQVREILAGYRLGLSGE